MANRGWEMVRRTLGKYPVPPVRPGGKWRPAGADALPPVPAGPVTALGRDLAEVSALLSDARARLQARAEAEPALCEIWNRVAMQLQRVHETLEPVRTWIQPHAEREARERLQQYTRAEQERAQERAEARRIERNEKARKKRAAERRARARDKS